MQLPKVVAAFVTTAALTLTGYRRQEFFVSSGVHGKLLIGSGIAAALVTGLTMVVYLQTTAAGARGAAVAIGYLPLALVLAAMNRFAEELRHITANQAISVTAVLFGIAHYRGTPSGFPGMGLTFVAGWVFGLAMVETRSILLPWFLHFVPALTLRARNRVVPPGACPRTITRYLSSLTGASWPRASCIA